MSAFWEALTPETRRLWTAGLVLGAYILFCLAIALREALRRRGGRRAADALSAGTGAPILVVHASQTGFAEELAAATAKLLGDAGARVTLKSLADVAASDLAKAGRALFVVSTTGEGDAPDTARRFIRDVMGREMMSGEPALHGLSYGVLALGDSSYAQFCAFGRTLDAWLARHGAAPLFDRVEVDDGDPAALRHWQSHVGVLAGVTDAPDWTRPRYGRWRLADRRRLNPGSPGLPHPARGPGGRDLGGRRRSGSRPAQRPGRGRGPAGAAGAGRLGPGRRRGRADLGPGPVLATPAA